MRVRFWGTRGSIATPGSGTVRFGGNTSCVEVTTASGACFVLDCGTGARPLGTHLVAHGPRPLNAQILLTHTHWDHIQGFPFFAPLFVKGNRIAVYGPKGAGRSLCDVLSGQMEYTYFPVELEQLSSELTYHELPEGLHEIGGIAVTTQYLNHPATSLGYRIEADGVSVLYLCDHEPYSETLWRSDGEPGRIDSILHPGDRRHAQFMQNADLVIHDAQYTLEEYPSKKNWGHSTYEYVVEVAAAAQVRQLALTHHDPVHDDAYVERIEQSARETARRRGSALKVFCAYEGCELTLYAPGTKAATPAPVASSEQSGCAKILIADDDPDLRLLARRVLAKQGFEVTEAGDGEEALQIIRQCPPDLVILDIMMPRMDGLQVLQTLRSEELTAHTPVLLLTSMADETTTRQGFEIGATDYLTKPFSLPQLAARVRACLERASSAP